MEHIFDARNRMHSFVVHFGVSDVVVVDASVPLIRSCSCQYCRIGSAKMYCPEMTPTNAPNAILPKDDAPVLRKPGLPYTRENIIIGVRQHFEVLRSILVIAPTNLATGTRLERESLTTVI
eukprot:scaffold16573_cov50-Attheya_sp.AAC.1